MWEKSPKNAKKREVILEHEVRLGITWITTLIVTLYSPFWIHEILNNFSRVL